MKKAGLILCAVLCATFSFAQSYGILMNGECYYPATYKGPDPYGEGFEEYLAHVQVTEGDYCQLYNATTKDAWVKPLNTSSVVGFTYNEAAKRYDITVSGCYDFYIKMKYDADELYIGPAGEGVVCTDGQDIDAGPIDPGYSGSAPASCPDVVLQAFYWDSYQRQ